VLYKSFVHFFYILKYSSFPSASTVYTFCTFFDKSHGCNARLNSFCTEL